MKIASWFLLLLLSANCSAKTVLFVGAEFNSVLEKSNDGKIVGLGADILSLMEQRLGYDIEIIIVPFKRALKMMENGSADGLIGPYKSANRERYMQYSQQHIYEDPLYFYCKKTRDIHWDGDLASVKNKTMAVVLGWFHGVDFERYRHVLSISDVVNLEAGVNMLLADRVDLILAYPAAIEGLAENLNIYSKIKSLKPTLSVNKGYFAFAKKRANKAFIQQFDEQLLLMAKNGELLKLIKKYPNLKIGY